MKNLKKVSIGVLALLLIVLLAGLPARAATNDSRVEVNIAGMTLIGSSWIEGFYLGRIGLGYSYKGIGFELGAVAAPWYGGSFVLFDGALVLNPLSEKPVSPVLRIGALMSTYGGFAFMAGGGLRLRLTSKFGFRAEYSYFPAGRIGLVGVGAFVNF
jgi:hypothetical protein